MNKLQKCLLAILIQLFIVMSDAQSQPLYTPLSSSTMQTYSVRLKPGQDIKKALETIVQKERIGAGAVLTCVGSLTDVTLRLANQENASEWKGHFEIVSLVGTLSTTGSHLHLSVSDSTGRTIGGHLLDGCRVYTTAELVIGTFPDLNYTREPDPTFGYQELVIRKRKRK